MASRMRSCPEPREEVPMHFGRGVRGAALASTLCCAIAVSAATPVAAATFTEFVDPHPATGNQFGAAVVPLSTGNVVITSPFDDAGGTDAGAVYLFNGATGALISTLHGSSPYHNIGTGLSGVTAPTNGNDRVTNLYWDNDARRSTGRETSSTSQR